MESDYRIPTAVGTTAWTVALVVLLGMGERLAADDRWWRWVCLTGIAFGIFAFVYIPRHLRRTAESGDDGSHDNAPSETDPADGRPVRPEGGSLAGGVSSSAAGRTAPVTWGAVQRDASSGD